MFSVQSLLAPHIEFVICWSIPCLLPYLCGESNWIVNWLHDHSLSLDLLFHPLLLPNQKLMVFLNILQVSASKVFSKIGDVSNSPCDTEKSKFQLVPNVSKTYCKSVLWIYSCNVSNSSKSILFYLGSFLFSESEDNSNSSSEIFPHSESCSSDSLSLSEIVTLSGTIYSLL